jgi:plasmid stability protein
MEPSMANLTITLDDELLKKARVKAAELETSVNAVLREYLEEWTQRTSERKRAIEEFVEGAKRSQASSGGRTWTRDELHERR